jgi:hypothetical protein
MARIQFDDLPLLRELSEEQLKELFGAGVKSFKPSIEALEDRLAMSGLAPGGAVGGLPYGQGPVLHNVHVETVFYGSDWTGGQKATEAHRLNDFVVEKDRDKLGPETTRARMPVSALSSGVCALRPPRSARLPSPGARSIYGA